MTPTRITIILLSLWGVNGSVFSSSMEAHFMSDPTKLCIGDCKEIKGQFLCTSDWSGQEKRCVATLNRTHRYRTYSNLECISNCDKFGSKNEWCATSESYWDYCTRRLALVGKRTHSTKNMYKTCADACEKRDYSEPWCNVVGKTWYPCEPDHITHTFDYTTVKGNKCVTRCQLDSEHVPYCYTNDDEYEKCLLNPSYVKDLNDVNDYLHKNCLFSDYEESGSLRLCGRTYTYTRHPRASDDEDENELFFNCNGYVDTIAASHAANNPTITLRRVDHNNIITNDPNPILSYTVLPTQSYFSTTPPTVDLPLVVRALLTSHTMGATGARDTFTGRVDANYNGLDRNLRHENYDERGHILASRLGGPMETFNVFPQTWRLNRGRDSLWFGLEADLDNFLRDRPTRHVFFTAVLSYATDDSHILVHRPTAVMLRIRAYDNNVQVHLDGTPVTPIRYNMLENIYFSNDPNHSCAPLPALKPKPGKG